MGLEMRGALQGAFTGGKKPLAMPLAWRCGRGGGQFVRRPCPFPVCTGSKSCPPLTSDSLQPWPLAPFLPQTPPARANPQLCMFSLDLIGAVFRGESKRDVLLKVGPGKGS